MCRCVCVSSFLYLCICGRTSGLGKRSDVCLVHHWDGGGAEDAGICPAPGAALVC